MIDVIIEESTDYLFPWFLKRELKKHLTDINLQLYVEPKRGEFYFCQDYSFSLKDYPYKFAFYALPSQREEHVKMMGKNCALVSYAADLEFHKPKPVKKIYDVGFIGKRYYPERIKYLEAIEKFYPRSFLNLDTCPNVTVPDRLSECRVLFNHTRKEIDVNLRFFEEMALGCQVMERNPFLQEFATEGVHYLGYSSPEELVEVIKKLLADDDLRQKITYNARSHFLANHTYAYRAQSVINHLEEYFKI